MMLKIGIGLIALLGGACSLAVVGGLAPGGTATYRTDLLKPSANFSDVYPRGRASISSTGVVLLAEPVYVDVRVPRTMDIVSVCLMGTQSTAITLGIRRQGSAWNYETVPYVLQSSENEACFKTFTVGSAALERGRLRLLVSAPVAEVVTLTNLTVRFTGQPLSLAVVFGKLGRTLATIKSSLW